MSTINARLKDESVAQDHIRNCLSPLIGLVEETISLYEHTGRAIADHPRPGSAARVGLMLVSRLASDIRVSSLSARLGYGIQALALGATIVELVGAMSYVGESESRAAEWAQHSDLRHSYPRNALDGIDAALASLGIFHPAAKANWRGAYTFMCTAKHANPRLSLLGGLRTDSSGFYHGYGPDASGYGIYMSSEALYYAIGFGMSGICVALNYCSDEALRARLREEAHRVLEARHGLESWMQEWSNAAVQELRTGEVNKEQISGIEGALHSETEELKHKTELMKQETRRLKMETAKIRSLRRRAPASRAGLASQPGDVALSAL